MTSPVPPVLPPLCSQWWRGDDGELHLCALPKGHTPECICDCARSYSETVEER